MADLARRPSSRAVFAFLVLTLALACSPAADTPETRVRETLAALETAAEAKDASAFRAYLSESYSDAEGHDTRAVMGIVTFHFLQNRGIHLLSRVSEVTIGAPGEAEVLALIAMAGTPIDSADALARVRADLWRFDVSLREESGDWRVTRAAWRPATIADFR